MKKLDLQKTLDDYVAGRINFVSQMNIFMGAHRKKDYYMLLGKHFVKTFEKSGKIVPGIEIPKGHKNFLRYLFDFKEQRAYTSAAIYLLTSLIDLKFLKSVFGEPLYHNEFGEGFDKEIGVDPKHRRKSFLSYFVEIKNVKFHIGIDHRGTSIEIQSDTTPQAALEALMELSDKYVEKI